MDQLRARWLDELQLMFRRPGMWARDAREMETVARDRLRNLCVVDDREADWEQAVSWLESFGKLGVHGPFLAMFGSLDCTEEVASVYAEASHRLGYLEVGGPMPAEFAPPMAVEVLSSRYEGKDLRRSEVKAIFGEPSLVIGKRVLCYTSAVPGARWTCFDCWPARTRRYEAGTYVVEEEPDPLVRTIRVSCDRFEDGLIMTLFGKVERWGPGWWIDHPASSASREQLGIATQLRQIDRDDPSQSLGSAHRGG